MALSIDATTNMTVVSNCDSATGWATSESTYSGFQREGSNCLGTKVSSTTYHNYVTVSSVDLTGRRVYAWMYPNGQVHTKANGGFRIVLGDGTNRRAYYVGGSDDYGFQVGAWTCLVLDCSNLPSAYAQLAGSAAPSITAITEIGIGCNITSKALGPVDNFFFDIVRHGTGIIVTSSSGDDITFADIAADDASTASGKAYGIIREIQPGEYNIQGDILLGNTSGGSIDFKDSSAVVFFEDRVHGSGTNTAYKFSGQHSATGTFSLELGVAVGSGDSESGRAGVGFQNANPTGQPVDFDFSDSDIEDVFMYGCSLTGLQGTVKFSADATNGISHHLSGCTFADCSQVDVGRTVVRNCIFSAYTPDTDGALLWNANINIKNCQFLGNTDATNDPHGIEHDTAGTYTYDNLTFSGNDYDINNSSTGQVTISATNGSDPSTYENTNGGTTTINNSVNLTMHVEDVDGNNLADVQCFIEKETPSVYTSAATGNNQGDGDFVVQEAIATDTPSSSWLQVKQNYGTTSETEQWYRYASFTSGTKTFAFNTKVGPYACTGGGTSTSLQDTVNDFTALDIEVGDTVRNETDGSWALVLDIVDANNITTTPLQGGTDNTWTATDNYSLHTLALTYDGADYAWTPWMNELTDTSGDAASVTNYISSVPIIVKARKFGYKPFEGAGTVSSSGYDVDLILAIQPNVGL